jgi:hypothetical protein
MAPRDAPFQARFPFVIRCARHPNKAEGSGINTIQGLRPVIALDDCTDDCG